MFSTPTVGFCPIFATSSLGGYMNQLENRTPLADQLMMGPDGAVYALRTATPQTPRSREGGEGSGCFAYSAEVPRRDSGQGTGCFRFSAEAPHRDGGEGTGCFKYSGDVPRRDGGNTGGCFKYSA